MEGHLERAKFEIAFGKFSPLRNFNLGRPPTRIRSQKKKNSLFFHHLFSTIQGSAFPNPTFFQTRLWALASFRARLWALGRVTWKNETTREILCVASSYRAGRLEQLDHSQNLFRVLFFIGQVTWKNETTREIIRVSFFIGQVAWNN
jgi:hypothetical protein